MSSVPVSESRKTHVWGDNAKILQEYIYKLISSIVAVEHIPLLLDRQSMEEYWIPAFTHKTYDAGNNYEMFEFCGDRVSGLAFTTYLYDIFGKELDQAKATLMLNNYMSKKFQPEISRRLGLVDYVRCNREDQKDNIDIQEDIFESFVGAFYRCADIRVKKGLGFVYCSLLLNNIFNSLQLDLENIKKDDITLLKELFDKLYWGEPQYITTFSDDPTKGEYKTTVLDRNGQKLGEGYGSEKGSKIKAAGSALEFLASKGFTHSSVDEKRVKRSREDDPELDLQYHRVNLAIKKINEKAAASGQPKIERYQLKQVHVSKAGSRGRDKGLMHTWALQAAYLTPDKKLDWKILAQETGESASATKVSLLKKFANNHGILSQIS